MRDLKADQVCYFALTFLLISPYESHILIHHPLTYNSPNKGMPEMLKASAAIMGAGLTNIALVTDGRYSGASHGFIVGHICPEAVVGGPVAVVRDGDMITIDAEKNRIDMNVSDEEIHKRLSEWKPPKMIVTRGVLAKYAKLVGDASHGAMTDLF